MLHNCILRNYIAIFDEYLVENTHSILHSQTKGSDSADELRKRAKSIFQSKGKQSDYRSFFITPRQFSFSHNQLRLLKVRCTKNLSESILLKQQLQHKCSNSCHTANNVPQQKYEDDCLPLGYHCDIKPDQTKKCDLPLCNISSQDENWTLLHGCFHSFIP